MEKKERFLRKAQKERENVPLSVIKSLLESDYVKHSLESAINCLEDEKARPLTVSHLLVFETALSLYLPYPPYGERWNSQNSGSLNS